MVASVSSIEAVVRIVRKHVSDEKFQVIVSELIDVPGNASFRESVMRLADLANIGLDGRPTHVRQIRKRVRLVRVKL
jgi:hypothetical protein